MQNCRPALDDEPFTESDEAAASMIESALSAKESHCSRFFGVSIRSVVPLPLQAAVPANAACDVEIVYDRVPHELQHAQSRGLRYQANAGELLLTVDGVARYLVSEGRRISIEREPDADDDDVRVFLLGSALGALLHQRGVLVLHGSAVVCDGVAVAFLGRSGAGKSTLAMAFARRGWPVLTDDLCVVRRDAKSGQMQVEPGLPHAKLWQDSLEKLAIPSEGLARVRRRIEKRTLPLENHYASAPVPLEHIYVLRNSNEGTLRIAAIEGPQKFNVLKNQTYRLGFLDGLGAKPAHFHNVLRLAEQATVSTVVRPRHPFLIDELTELIATRLPS